MDRLSRTEGWQVLEAGDAVQALMHLGAGKPPIDLVLLDLRLPDASGISLLQTFRRAWPRCQVILMTAYQTSEVEDAILDGGAFGVITKPFDLDEVHGLIDAALARSPW